jgi:hypothetical protein
MHAPQHVGHFIGHNLASVHRIRPRSVGFTEMDPGHKSPVPQMKHALPGYRICTDTHGQGPHSQEVPIAVRTGRHHQVLTHRVVSLSPKVGRLGVANDRWMTITEQQHWRLKLAHIALHLNAGIQDQHTGKMHPLKRTRVTEDAVRRVETAIGILTKRGFEVVVTGDWNWRDHGVPWDSSPLAVAQRNHMHAYGNGLDWILWTRGLKQQGKVRVIPRETPENRADHPWLVIRLRRRLFGSGKK